jgi:peptidoglycan/LPS O-acetylase OafA/YrhL
MLRIWPLYLSFASAVCLLTIMVGGTSTKEVAAWWLSHLTFSNNLMTALDGYSNVLFSSHLWTISLEEQAYFVLPLILVAALRVGIRVRSTLSFCGVAIILLIVSRAGFLLAGARHPFIWVLPLRADAFIFGAAAAILISQGTLRPREWLFMPGIGLISCVALFPSVETPSAYHIIGYTLTAFGCALVVVASQAKLLANKFLGRQPLRYLGKISYGLYVYHLAAIFGANWLIGRAGLPPEWEFLVALAITIGMAALSYAILERPFLLLKGRYAPIASRPV